MGFNDIYRLRIVYQYAQVTIYNVLHFVEDIAFVGNGMQGLADDFRDSMGTSLRARASSEVRFDRIEVQSIIPYGPAVAQALWPANTFGTNTGNAYSATLCEVITLWTGQVGRRKRGRIYLPPAPATSISQGFWNSAQSARTQTFATNLLNRYAVIPLGSSWALGVWSRAIGGAQPPYSTNGFTRVTAVTVRNTVRTQRRRQAGVGV